MSKKITASGISCIIAIFLIVLVSAFDFSMIGQMTYFQPVKKFFKVTAITILVAGSILNIRQYSMKQMVAYGLYGLTVIGCTYTLRTLAPLLLLLIWINMQDVEADDILKICFVVQLIIFLTTWILYLFKLLPDRLYLYLGDIRSSLGYNYPNSVGTASMIIVLLYISIRKEKTTIWEFFGLFVFTFYVFSMSKSKGSFCSILIALIFFAVIRMVKFSNMVQKFFCIGTALSYIFLFAFSFFYAALVDISTPFWSRINSILTNRLALGKDAFNLYKITLFGQRIEWVGVSKYTWPVPEIDYNFVDSSYLGLLFDYGWFFMIVLLILYVLMCIWAYKKKNWYVALLLFIFALHGFIERSLFSIGINPLLILMGYVFPIGKGQANKPLYDLQSIKEYIWVSKWYIVMFSLFMAGVFFLLGKRTGQMYVLGNIEATQDWSSCILPVNIVLGIMVGMITGIIVIVFVYLMKNRKKAIDQ